MQRKEYYKNLRKLFLVYKRHTIGWKFAWFYAKILKIPIITTDVSDSKKDIEGKYGIVVEKSEKGVYEGMKEFLKQGFHSKEFDSKKYNDDILEKLEKIISNN